MSQGELLLIAKKAALNAYAPYSGMRIGAALLDHDGNVYTGCNIENSSYGLTICAERSAVANAISSAGKIKFKTMAVFSEQILPVPCGACAQFIAEFSPDIELIIADNDQSLKTSLKTILPSPFKLKK